MILSQGHFPPTIRVRGKITHTYPCQVEDTKLELVQYTSESCATIAQRDDKITELEKALEQIKHDMGDTYNVLNR